MTGYAKSISGDAESGRVSRWRSGRRMMKRRKCKHAKLRARLGKSTPDWLKHYLPRAYPFPWGVVHLDIIKGAEDALETGGKFVVAAPRGTGKSTLLWGVALKFVLQGSLKFPALLPWKASELRKALRFWKNALCFNAKLLADYPGYCQPFAESRGSSQKCMTLCWSDTEQPAGAELRVSDGMMVFPDGRGAIGSSTINGNPRGLNHATEDGRVLRPDLVFIDDPQDKSAAKSPSQTASIIDIIDTDVMGMAGPNQRMPALLASTVIQRGDAATHYLAAPDWVAVKVGQIVEWPGNMKLWDEFGKMIKEKREPDALNYYAANKDELIKGMSVSWESRFDKKRKEPDAFYSAMRDFFFMGEKAFMAERQNDPIEEGGGDIPPITPKIICSRVADRDAFVIPDWVGTVIFSTDLNPSYAFTSAIVGFGKDQTAAVIWYGLFAKPPLPIKNEVTPAVRKQKVYEALIVHGRELASFRCRNDGWYIDASGEYFDPVNRFCAASLQLCGIQATAATGSAGKRYRPFGKNVYGQPRENCHKRSDFFDGRRRIWLNWHADYWRDVSQRAWLGSIGSPGSLSLFKGHHLEFANQCSAEKLIKKGEGLSGKTEWIWQTSAKHDYGDVMAQAFAGAAWNGVGTSGQSLAPMRRRDVRRVRHINV